MAEPMRAITGPRRIASIKMLNSVNFNRTENTTLYAAGVNGARDDKCEMLQTALGIEVTGGKHLEALLIPWVNICFVRYA